MVASAAVLGGVEASSTAPATSTGRAKEGPRLLCISLPHAARQTDCAVNRRPKRGHSTTLMCMLLKPALLVTTALVASACAMNSPPPVQTAAASPPAGRHGEEPAPGPVARGDVEALPSWIRAKQGSRVAPAAARALADVPAGATVQVYLGTWCGDSRREVSRFWQALDGAADKPAFAIELIAVDAELQTPSGLTEGMGLRYVPTFIVLREGREVGRIVESAETSIEADLVSLLRGERSGLISGRADGGR